jgi:hypothetical protein
LLVDGSRLNVKKWQVLTRGRCIIIVAREALVVVREATRLRYCIEAAVTKKAQPSRVGGSAGVSAEKGWEAGRPRLWRMGELIDSGERDD